MNNGETLVEALGAQPMSGKEYDAARRDIVKLASGVFDHEAVSYTTTLGKQLRLFATMDKLIMDAALLVLAEVGALSARMDAAVKELEDE